VPKARNGNSQKMARPGRNLQVNRVDEKKDSEEDEE